MKRIGFLLLSCALTATGCTFTEAFVTRQVEQEKKVELPPPPPPVMADGINDRNVMERVRSLRKELEMESRRPMPVPKETKPTEADEN